MAARKRRSNESFEAYRENLKFEELQKKASLAGRMLWPSSEYGTAEYKRTKHAN